MAGQEDEGLVFLGTSRLSILSAALSYMSAIVFMVRRDVSVFICVEIERVVLAHSRQRLGSEPVPDSDISSPTLFVPAMGNARVSVRFRTKAIGSKHAPVPPPERETTEEGRDACFGWARWGQKPDSAGRFDNTRAGSKALVGQNPNAPNQRAG